MPETAELFFDYLSPYAYLAWGSVRGLCARMSVELRARPVLLAGLLHHWGQLGPAEIPPKGLFAFRDCLRKALAQGVPFHAPKFHPFNPLTALRVSLPEVAGADQVRVIDALWRAGWGEGADLGSDREIVAIVDAAGLDGAGLVQRTSEPDVKDALRASTNHAIELGVFGVPTVVVQGELFWGTDQLPHIEKFLAGEDPLATIDLTLLAPQGSSATRRRDRQ